MGPLDGSCVSKGEPCSSERGCMRMTIPVPGRLGATFLSSSITVLLFGVMVSCRGGGFRPLLETVYMDRDTKSIQAVSERGGAPLRPSTKAGHIWLS
jgi:hypothetical protein